MKKLIVSILIFCMMMMVLIASVDAKNFVLNYNQLEPEEHPQGVTLTKFKEKIEELSGGTIKINAYYSGSLFTQEGEVTALMAGDLDMSTLAFQDMGPYLPAASMFAAPYIFTSYEHMEKVFSLD